MWNFLMITMMLAATGVYSSNIEQKYTEAKHDASQSTAENMALYREAVVQYFNAHDVKNTSIPVSKLTLPSWLVLYTNGTSALWSNYRDANGVIYIFPVALTSTTTVNEVLGVSQYSSLVGVYRAANSTIYYPTDNRSIAAPSLSNMRVPNGAPVWTAMRG